MQVRKTALVESCSTDDTTSNLFIAETTLTSMSQEMQKTEAEFISLDVDHTWIARHQRIPEVRGRAFKDKSEKIFRHPLMQR